MPIHRKHLVPRVCPLEVYNADEAGASVAVVEGEALDHGEVRVSAERYFKNQMLII